MPIWRSIDGMCIIAFNKPLRSSILLRPAAPGEVWSYSSGQQREAENGEGLSFLPPSSATTRSRASSLRSCRAYRSPAGRVSVRERH
jgi:hypothetical protein